jgi:hypothetical protein
MSRPDAAFVHEDVEVAEALLDLGELFSTCAGCATTRGTGRPSRPWPPLAFVSFAWSSEWKKFSRMCAARAASSRARRPCRRPCPRRDEGELPVEVPHLDLLRRARHGAADWLCTKSVTLPSVS